MRQRDAARDYVARRARRQLVIYRQRTSRYVVVSGSSERLLASRAAVHGDARSLTLGGALVLLHRRIVRSACSRLCHRPFVRLLLSRSDCVRQKQPERD